MNYINSRLKAPWALLYLVSIVLFSTSCKKFLEVTLDPGQIQGEDVFSDENNAISAINGLYQVFNESSFGGGGSTGTSLLTGLSSDEISIILKSPDYLKFELNDLLADDKMIEVLWNDAYKIIYQANDIIESVEKSSALTTTVKNKIKGEALFVRAYTYFYLVNMFGDVPLVLTTDYRASRLTPRTALSTVMDQIISDLKEAKEKIPEAYPNNSRRSRPNRAAVSALLARVSLYKKDWTVAEEYASEVINDPGYSINPTLDNVFKINSNETIWQLASEANFNTKESLAFFIEYGVGSNSVALTQGLLNAFSDNDQRREKWLGAWYEETSDTTFYFPYKYKASYYGATSEFLVVLRLAEQYLIRAEARANLGDLEGAIADLDMIRERAGVEKIAETDSDASQEELLDYVANERRVELFTEWGHRWLDLKRWGVALDTLVQLKPDLTSNDLLYPVPQIEFDRNPNLGEQNNGY